MFLDFWFMSVFYPLTCWYLTVIKPYDRISLSFYRFFSKNRLVCFVSSFGRVTSKVHPLTNVLKYHVALLLKPEVGAALELDVNEVQQNLGDLKVDYVRGQLLLTRTTRGVLATGQFQTALQAECVRCLEPFSLEVPIPMEEMFAFTPASDPIYYIDEGWLDLRKPLREQIMLALPMHLLCRPDCKGLCPQCGQNLNEGPCSCDMENIDPRLAALKKLL